MGYTTWFTGGLQFNKPVTEELKNYINRFSKTRRMPRDNDKIKEIYPNWKELCFMGKLGNNGEYFAPESYSYGQELFWTTMVLEKLYILVFGASGSLKTMSLSGMVARSFTIMRSGLII